ncbi:hypothetical protein GGX14DRAFT_644876 [Mycena pura]|uniref:Uncharacterized protein n=1 Tax=Mycena pura TaxID=153505 RepID=A0AAD6V8P0_9AGAR|nr:hypothetical protein GGX14DRAFT_644876 [Mycena pura]
MYLDLDQRQAKMPSQRRPACAAHDAPRAAPGVRPLLVKRTNFQSPAPTEPSNLYPAPVSGTSQTSGGPSAKHKPLISIDTPTTARHVFSSRRDARSWAPQARRGLDLALGILQMVSTHHSSSATPGPYTQRDRTSWICPGATAGHGVGVGAVAMKRVTTRQATRLPFSGFAISGVPRHRTEGMLLVAYALLIADRVDVYRQLALELSRCSWAIKYDDLYPSFVGGPEDLEDDTSDSDSLSVGLSHDPDPDLNTCDQWRVCWTRDTRMAAAAALWVLWFFES